jgi:hypothetical protein
MHPLLANLEYACQALAADDDRPLDEHALNEIVAAELRREADVSPWETWLLLVLLRRRLRQEWGRDVVRNVLSIDSKRINRSDAEAGPSPNAGVVPGQEGWEYAFFRYGYTLSHRDNGESIRIESDEFTAEWVDPYCLQYFLRSYRHPPFPERRLKELHCGVESVWLAALAMIDAELVEDRQSSRYRLEVRSGSRSRIARPRFACSGSGQLPRRRRDPRDSG